MPSFPFSIETQKAIFVLFIQSQKKGGDCMRKILCAVKVIAIIAFLNLSVVGQESPATYPTLSPELLNKVQTVPQGAPWQVAPGKPWIHIQLGSFHALVEMLDTVIRESLPPEAVPPPVAQALKSPSPTLIMLGKVLDIAEEECTEENLARRFGINPREPISLTFYPGNPTRAFLLSLPLENTEWLSRMRIWKSIHYTTLPGDVPVLEVVFRRPHSPTFYLLTAPDRIYLTCETSIAVALAQEEPQARFGQDQYVAQAMKQIGPKDFIILVNGQLARIGAMQTSIVKLAADTFLSQWLHRHIIQQSQRMPKEAREVIDLGLIQRLGIHGREELVSYLRAFAMGTVDWILEEISGSLVGCQYFSFSVHLDAHYPELGFALYSSTLNDRKYGRPFSKTAVQNILEKIQSQYTILKVTGQKPQIDHWRLWKRWIQAIQARLDLYGLDSPFFNRLARTITGLESGPTVEQKARWIACFCTPAYPFPNPTKYNSLREYLFQFRSPQWTWIHVADGLNMARFAQILQAQVKCAEQNKTAVAELLGVEQTWRSPFHLHYQFVRGPVQGPIHTFIQETRWTTDWGLCDFDQHEFISRKIYHAQTINNLLIYEKRLYPSTWLKECTLQENGSWIPALQKLWDRVPNQMQQLVLVRVLPLLPEYVDWLAKMEQLLRRELDMYLQQCREIWAQYPDNPEARRKALAEVLMPEFVASLNYNPEQDRLYLVLPGWWVYPRPRFIPVFQKLLKDYRTLAPNIGGGVGYVRIKDGQYEIRWIQNLDSLTRLIFTTTKKLAEIMQDETAQKDFLSRWHCPGDRSPRLLKEIFIPNVRYLGMIEAGRRTLKTRKP